MKKLSTYDLERIARDLVENGGGSEAVQIKVSQIADKNELGGDEINTLWDMILDIAAGLPV